MSWRFIAVRSRKGGRKVVSFLPSASKAGRYVLLLDDGRKVVSYQLGLEEASLFPLYVGKVLSAKEENALAQALASSKARSKALALLKRRPYAEKELEERLLRDGKLNYTEVKEATRFLSEEGLVDDRSYAVDKAEEAAYTLKGKRKVLHELREAGVEESIVSSLSFDQEREKAAEDLKRILPRLASCPLKEKKEKAWRALSRDGYEDEVIFPLLATLSEDEERVLARLEIEARNAYRRLERKYNGRELNGRVYEALARKGFRPSAIRAVMERLSNDLS